MKDQKLDDYIAAHIDAEPEHLAALNRYTQIHHLYGNMCSGHMQGRLLAMITSMIRPRRVVELGAFTGYSTLCIAEAMAVCGGGVIDTIEINDESADELNERFACADTPGVEIRLHIDDAEQAIVKLGGPWDMAFIDANKRRYVEYYQLLMDRMPSGAFILADNTLWSDKILHPGENRDAQTSGIMAFNDLVAADTRVSKVILPVRDGLTVIRKL
ncbi:MAG: O-methyltransferase [Muribaculaceae bacterium]|nr:O-methyltransferase [Muribaculaceae bacterium]